MEDKQAYDFKLLVEKLKDHGMDVAEDVAMVILEAVTDWVMESAKKSENKYDDLLLAVMPILKEEVFKQIDKLDGEAG